MADHLVDEPRDDWPVRLAVTLVCAASVFAAGALLLYLIVTAAILLGFITPPAL